MTESTELAKSGQYAVMPVMDIQAAVGRRDAIVQFVQGIMVENVDFGKIPGTNKDVLLKPGAEKLTTFFGLSPHFDILEKVEDWTGSDHAGEPFFYFQYKCRLYRGDMLVGEGVGSCNSWEKKYRYRKGDLVCPNCGKSGTVIKGKAEYGGGWLCRNKKGGCGSKWPDGAEEIEGQDVGQVKNDNPADLVNTIDKMAQKRALIAATLIAVNASEFFTQDIEDMAENIIEGNYTEQPDPYPEETKPPSERRKRTPKKQTVVQRIVDEGLADNAPNAANILNAMPSGLMSKLDDDAKLRFATIYRAYRNKGEDTDSAATLAADDMYAYLEAGEV